MDFNTGNFKIIMQKCEESIRVRVITFTDQANNVNKYKKMDKRQMADIIREMRRGRQIIAVNIGIVITIMIR